jgi:hypothetical protein
MADVEKYRQKYLQVVSERVGEPVEAVGIFSRPGSMGSMFLGQLSPLASMVKSKMGKGASGGLPQNVVIGVAADKVFVFEYKPKGTSIKLKDPIAVFERAAMRAEVLNQGTMATRVRFHLPNGDAIELDSNRMPGSSSDFNAPVVQALAAA